MTKGLSAVAAGMFLFLFCNQLKDASATTADNDYMAIDRRN